MALKHRQGENPLRGRIQGYQLRGAAKELLAIADHQERKAQVDGAPVDYRTKEEVGCIEDKLSDGRWKLYVVEPFAGAMIYVIRADRQNLMPALLWECICHLCKSGRCNELEEAKRHVLDKLNFKVVECYTGKVR